MAVDKKKPVFFLGNERPWQEVFEYYEMIREAYGSYIAKKCEEMTESKRLYVHGFKERVDNVAKILGIENRMALPDNIDKIRKSRAKETNEEDNG